MWSQYEKQTKRSRALEEDIPYDYFSIMQYGKNTFAKEDANVSTNQVFLPKKRQIIVERRNMYVI